jgi:hypothetical protein
MHPLPLPPAPRDRALARDLIVAVVPAYLFPFATSFPGAVVMGNPELLAASMTAIPIPGAVAAAVVVLITRGLEARLAPSTRIVPWRALLAGLVACGAMSAAILLAMIEVAVLPAASFGYAAPSAAIGGAVTAFTWARRRARAHAASAVRCGTATAALATATLAIMGCGPALPRVSLGQITTFEATSPDVATFRAVAEVCHGWASTADDEASSARRRQTRAGTISAVSGTLGTLSGAIAAVSSATANDGNDSARVAQVSGTIALSVGIIAGIAGMRANRQGHRIALTLNVGVGIERAVRRRTERMLAAPSGSVRDGVAQFESAAMLVDCAQAARRLSELATLPVALGTPPAIADAVALLRARPAGSFDSAADGVATVLRNGAEVAP